MKKMNLIKLSQNFLSRIFSWVAVFSMVMLPVAQGQEAKNITTQQMKTIVEELGLNKKLTLGEFYLKNKDLFSDRVRQEVEPYFMARKNELMPQFELVTTKGTDGNEVPTMRVNADGELINIQWFGDKNKYVKFQNTVLSEIDIINFDDMFKRISAADEKFRKQIERPFESTHIKNQFKGYPEVSAETWKKMSLKDRAAYIVNMRLLWNDARRVLQQTESTQSTKGSKKTSQNESILQKWENFLFLINRPVEAKKNPDNVKPPVKANAGSTASVSSDNCLVAGYISSYTNGSCGIDSIMQNYPNDELIKKANDDCKNDQGKIACNPLIYGTPGGAARCITPSRSKADSFQKATHFDGPCEENNHLGSKANIFKTDKDPKNDSKRYDNLLSEKELAEKFKKEQVDQSKLVEDYLNGILTFQGKNTAIDFREPLNESSLQAILKIKAGFDKDIANARESCVAASRSNKYNEPNFWGACDQLHRRFLNVAEFLEKKPGCQNDSKINEELMCVCPAPDVGKKVYPGVSCKGPAAVTTPAAGDQPADPAKPAEKNKPVPSEICATDNPPDNNCKCKDSGKPPKEIAADTTGNTGAKVYSCTASVDETKEAKKAEDCGFLCNIAKNPLRAVGWAVVATAGVYLGYKLLNVKKPKLKAAADMCPGSTSAAPCVQTCGAYQTRQNGICACSPCIGGQVLTAAATCTCSSTSTATTGALLCADGVTQVTDLATCPLVTCPDGVTKVVLRINCPVTTNKIFSKPGGVSK